MVRRVLILLLLVLLSGSSLAFKTFTALGGDIHEQILNEALEGLIGAYYLERADAGNTWQDIDNLDDPHAHFDDCTFAGSQNYIKGRWETAVQEAGRGRYGSAAYHFGGLIHTVQDFYSHSNYVELHLKQGMAPSRIPPADWSRLPANLKTGYFSEYEGAGLRLTARDQVLQKYGSRQFHSVAEFYQLEKQPEGRDTEYYRYALDYVTGPETLLHLEVNKDNAKSYMGRVVHPGTGWTLHEIARRVAVKDTRRTWLRFLNEVGRRHGQDHVQALSGRALDVSANSEPLFPKATKAAPQPPPAPPLPPPDPGGPPSAELLEMPDGKPPLLAGKSSRSSAPPKEAGFQGVDDPLPPSGGGEMSVSIEGRLEVEEGERLLLLPRIEGGTPPYQVVWRANGREMEAPRIDTEASGEADGELTVVVTDSQGRLAQTGGRLRIYPQLKADIMGPKYVCTQDQASYRAQVSGGSGTPRAEWSTGFPSQPPGATLIDGSQLSPGPNEVVLRVYDQGLYRAQPKTFTKKIIVHEPLTAELQGPASAQAGKPTPYTLVTRGGYGLQNRHWSTRNHKKSQNGWDPSKAYKLRVHFKEAGQDFVEVRIEDRTNSGRPLVIRRPVSVTGQAVARPAKARPKRIPGNYHATRISDNELFVAGLNQDGSVYWRRGVTMNVKRGQWSYRDGVLRFTLNKWRDYYEGRLIWTDHGFKTEGYQIDGNGRRKPESFRWSSTD